MRWGGHVADMEENRNAYRFLVGKERRKGKETSRIPRRRREADIKMELREIG
jgi:hypothetical protein